MCKYGLWALYYCLGGWSWCGEQGIGQEDQSKHVEMLPNVAVPASKNLHVKMYGSFLVVISQDIGVRLPLWMGS